jgi:YidC/Oxa1 family membrane protein insertase
MKQNEKFLTGLAVFVAGFVLFCGVLVFRSGLFNPRSLLVQTSSGGPNNFILLSASGVSETNEPPADVRLRRINPSPLTPNPLPAPASPPQLVAQATAGGGGSVKDEEKREIDAVDSQNQYWAVGGDPEKIFIGAKDPNTEDPQIGFPLQLELDSAGASIRKATLSCGAGKGFNDRNPKGPKPLVLLSPVGTGEKNETLSMANQSLVLVEQNIQLALNTLSWKTLDRQKNDDGSQSVSFEAEINYAGLEPVLKIRKTYTIYPKNYYLDCYLTVENVSVKDQKISFNLAGPVGITREDKRSDDRKAIGGFVNAKGQITTAIKQIANLKKAATESAAGGRLSKDADNFLWAAIVNKYFAAILVPVADEGTQYCKWIKDKKGLYFDPDQTSDSGDETIGIDLKTTPDIVKTNSSRTYKFQLYLGPKDKEIFDKDKRFKDLGFVNAIDMPCCFFCPLMVIIRPLAFGLITLMDLMYKVLPNYGVVIIILVLIVRLLMHPLTRKGQVAMSKMGKLAPMVEEIKKKYGNDKIEMNKQIAAFYKEHGATPILGMLPMLLQMPIWVALYSAIDASISLRGAKFLPVWITDLSAPDAVFSFPQVNLILFSFSSLNLLPILMGVAFYLQQKLTPQQPSTAANPQLAQQQKMMAIMTTVLFPLMLYSAPSGLNLYIMASTFAGAIEQYVIKKHIEQQEQTASVGLVSATSKTGGKVKKKKPKPFFKKYI